MAREFPGPRMTVAVWVVSAITLCVIAWLITAAIQMSPGIWWFRLTMSIGPMFFVIWWAIENRERRPRRRRR